MKNFFKMILASCLGVTLASLVVLIIFFTMLGTFISSVSSEIKNVGQVSSKTVNLTDSSILRLNMSGLIADSPNEDLFKNLLSSSDDDRQYQLKEITDAIDRAATNEHISGISLELSDAAMGYATAQELRDHLTKFKASGKKIYAFSNNYGYGNYFVSSLADKIYINPQGMVNINGLASTTLFYTGPLKKLGIQMQVFKVGTYKGAVEPFILNKLSDANRAQIQSYLDGLWQGTLGQIASGRNIPTDRLQAMANAGGAFMPTDSLERFGLVDSMIYAADYKRVLAEKVVHSSDPEKLTFVSIGDFLNATAKEVNGNGTIALVYAEGGIVNIHPDDSPFGLGNDTKSINRSLIKELRDLANDDDVNAVVMRVNSPGGDAFLSEEIFHEVQKLKEKKPIVISMGNYAASGGYYISCAANKIFAEPTTLTGSIGIFGMFPNMAGTAQKIDLTYDTVKTSELADIGNQFRPMTDNEKAVIQATINRGYDTFISRVASGRGMTKEAVNNIGQGRVWLGSQAIEKGLVDELGGLDSAIKEAAKLAHLDTYTLKTKKQKTIMERLFDATGDKVKAFAAQLTTSPEQRFVRNAIQIIQQRTGIMARPPYSLEEIKTDSRTPFALP